MNSSQHDVQSKHMLHKLFQKVTRGNTIYFILREQHKLDIKNLTSVFKERKITGCSLSLKCMKKFEQNTDILSYSNTFNR